MKTRQARLKVRTSHSKPGPKSRQASASQAPNQDKTIQARPKARDRDRSRQVNRQRQTKRHTKLSIRKEKRKKIKMQSETVACGGPIRLINIGRFCLAPAFGFGVCDT